MSTFASIQSLLTEHLKTLPDLPDLQEENTRGVARSGATTTRITLLPTQTTPLTLGVTGLDTKQGIAQIDVFVPQDTGVAAANDLVDAVVAHFPRGLTLTDPDTNTRLHIGPVSRAPGRRMSDSPLYMVPVSVQWSSIG